MNFSNYLAEYALIHIFQGNKSSYARALELDEGNFRRMIRNMTNNKVGDHLVDQTIMLCVQQGIDVASIFRDYQSLIGPNAKRRVACAFDYYVKRAKAKLEKFLSLAVDDAETAETYNLIQGILHDLESKNCGKNNQNHPNCKFYHAIGQFLDME